MEIKAVKFRRDGFYTQPFAFGGEEGPEKFDRNVRYRGSLQNYLIDTGDEVILVDTGLPAGTPEEVLEHYRKSTFEHISILQFIRDGMAAEARQAMELHITRSMANMLRFYPETDERK